MIAIMEDKKKYWTTTKNVQQEKDQILHLGS